jgi:putative membrane protein
MLTWAITSLSLWAASYVFDGLQFNDSGALIISALVLGLANAIVYSATNAIKHGIISIGD